MKSGVFEPRTRRVRATRWRRVAPAFFDGIARVVGASSIVDVVRLASVIVETTTERPVDTWAAHDRGDDDDGVSLDEPVGTFLDHADRDEALPYTEDIGSPLDRYFGDVLADVEYRTIAR